MRNIVAPDCSGVLKKRRKELGLMQKEVAERAGINLRLYQKYEKEQNLLMASFMIACRVLSALDFDISEFYEQAEDQLAESVQE